MTISWKAAGATDVGRVRKGNEDALALDSERGVFLVADGMGGHAAGEVASRLAAETAVEVLVGAVAAGSPPGDAFERALDAAFQEAHRRIVEHGHAHAATRGMGTTLTACVLHPDGFLQVGHLGDSRLYHLHEGRLEQVTRDHTWVQREIEAGRLAARAALHHPLSHILTRVLSEDSDPEPDILFRAVAPGDLLLLATDGLTGMVPDEELHQVLSETLTPEARVSRLVAAANAAGGTDNVTAVVVEVG